MKQLLLRFNESAHLNELKFATSDLALYNSLLEVIKSNDPAFQLDMSNLKALIKNPKEYAFDKIVDGKPLTIAGVPVSKKKAMDFVEMPKEWNTIIEAVQAFNDKFIKNPIHNLGHNSGNMDRLPLSAIVIENGVLVLDENFIAESKSKHSIYTQNENQIIAHQHLTAMHNSFVELTKLGVNLGGDLSLYEIGFTPGNDGVVRFDPLPVIQRVR